MPSETGITSILGVEKQANKNQAGGYPSLDSAGHIPYSELGLVIADLFEYEATASDYVRGGDGAGVNVPSSLTTLLVYTFKNRYNGTIRTKMTLVNSTDHSETSGQVYYNDVILGAHNTRLGNVPQTFIEEFTNTYWKVGDTIKIKGSSGNDDGTASNMYICFDLTGNLKIGDFEYRPI